MATVIRVKRRRDEDALQALYIQTKKRRTGAEQDQGEPEANIFKFAATVATKVTKYSRLYSGFFKLCLFHYSVPSHLIRAFSKNNNETRTFMAGVRILCKFVGQSPGIAPQGISISTTSLHSVCLKVIRTPGNTLSLISN